MRIFIWGINGKMGRVLADTAEKDQTFEIAGGFDLTPHPAYPTFDNIKNINVKCDVVIDFSLPGAIDDIAAYCARTKTAAVIAATGHSPAQLQTINSLAKVVPVFKSGNMSVGVNLLLDLVEKAARQLGESYDIEIIEKHHNQKVDAPSGTALMLAAAANFEGRKTLIDGRSGHTGARKNEEIGMHAVRGGTICGEHDVIFAGNDEIITLSHTALSKKIFAVGSLRAARLLAGKKAGLYSFKNN